MSKIVSKDIEKLKKGIDTVADAVKVTIGPRGKNVIIEGGLYPTIANDGGRIAKEIILKDPIENMGASVIKQVIQKTSEDVGGGRTASAIITQALITEGLKLTNKGFNANLLKKGMQLAVKDIHAELDKMAQPVKGKAIEQVATISTESEELGKVIAETMQKIGQEGIVTVEESNSFGISTEINEGLKFDRGYISPYMVTNERMEAEYKNIPVLIIDKKISFFKEIQSTLDILVEKNIKDLLIIAEDLDGEALNICVLAKLKGQFNILAIKTPGVGDMKKFCLEDLAALTGATVGGEFNKAPKLGKAKKVVSKKDSTIIIGGDVKEWVEELKTRRALTEKKWEIDQFNERIAKLENGVATIRVGASSETEVKYLKLKIEDGVNEAKRAMEEGVVIGGNCAFVHAYHKCYIPRGTSEQDLGYSIVLNACLAPLTQIVENSAGKPDIVIHKIIKNESKTSGYDSINNEVIDDMYKEGIIDAVKVTKTVLQNAVSVASMFLSVDSIIANEPERRDE